MQRIGKIVCLDIFISIVFIVFLSRIQEKFFLVTNGIDKNWLCKWLNVLPLICHIILIVSLWMWRIHKIVCRYDSHFYSIHSISLQNTRDILVTNGIASIDFVLFTRSSDNRKLKYCLTTPHLCTTVHDVFA